MILLSFFGRSGWVKRKELAANWKGIALPSLTGVVGFNSTLYLSLQFTTAISAAMIFAITPLIILVLSAVVYGSGISVTQFVAVALSVTGALVVLGSRALFRIYRRFDRCFVLLDLGQLLRPAQDRTYRCACGGHSLLASVMFGLLIEIPLGVSETAIVGMPRINLSRAGSGSLPRSRCCGIGVFGLAACYYATRSILLRRVL